MAEKELRAQPVLPFALTVCRLKPPANEPQVRLAALSRSPTLFPVIWTSDVLLEHTSPKGSVSPFCVKPPWPSATPVGEFVLVSPGMAGYVAPLVWPENISSAPGVDG